MRRAALLLAACVLAAAATHAARADGDPASDYLVGEKLFLPYDAKFPPKQAAELTALVKAANKAGYKIRVAIIWSDYDMGSVTSLWHKPATYAKFLGLELGYVYKQRLLIVESNGFGFNWPKHPTGKQDAILAKIAVPPGPGGLLTAAQQAVTKLAAADGVKVAAPAHVTTAAQQDTHDREIILAAVVGALALAAAARFAIRRRSRGRS
jgi:hypothetical protein